VRSKIWYRLGLMVQEYWLLDQDAKLLSCH
jgi:hypothetical protein